MSEAVFASWRELELELTEEIDTELRGAEYRDEIVAAVLRVIRRHTLTVQIHRGPDDRP